MSQLFLRNDAPTQEMKEKMLKIGELANQLYQLFNSPTREHALARTKLEESVMWGNKGICINNEKEING